MFKRRQPRSRLWHLKELFWPSMGWVRTFKYVRYRILRLSDTTHKIAGGLAVGAMISYSPLVGTHFVQAALISYLLRFNVLASLVGTAVGNPWTFPFIWWSGYELGAYIFGIFGWQDGTELPDEMTLGILWEIVKTQPMQIFLPWMLGGYLAGFILWFPAYLIYYALVKGGRAARRQVRLHNLHKAAQEVTGQKE